MIKLRIARPEDADALLKIYEYYVTSTTVTFEYDPPSVEEFSDRIAARLTKYPYIVAELDGRIVGYAYAAEYRSRRAYDHSVELSVYVSREERHTGIGTRLYTALVSLLRAQNFATAYVCITIPNSPSVAFHEEMGFELIGYFHKAGYKHGAWLDVAWYELPLCDYGEPSPVIPFPEMDSKMIEDILNCQ